MSRRRWAILAFAALLFWLCRRAYWVGFFNDDAYYLLGARSLLTGRYAELSAPGAPPLVDYLPGWPLLLAPAVLLARGSLAALQGFAVALHVAALALLGSVFEREDSAETADLALAAVALSPLVASTAGTLLSDGPMLFCAAAALAALPRLWPRRGSAAWLGFGLALGLAALVRPNGLALAAAVAIALSRERRLREATCVLVPAALVLFLWLERDRALSGQAWNYWAEAESAARAGGVPVVPNAFFYARELFARALWRPPFASRPAEAAVALAGTAFALLGFARARSPAARAMAAFAVVFLAPQFAWGKTAARYLIPVLPFGLWGAWRGLARLDRRAALAGAGLGVVLSAWATAGVARASWRPATRLSVPPARTAAWLKAQAGPDAVLAAEYDGRWNLLTGLPAVHVPYDARAPRALAAFAVRRGVTHVLVEDTSYALRPAGGDYAVPTAEELRMVVAASPSARLVFSDEDERTEVWRLAPVER